MIWQWPGHGDTLQGGPVSAGGNGWVFSSLESPRAYLHTQHAMSWVEAEDFCQMIYGHLATGGAMVRLLSEIIHTLLLVRWFSRVFERISETESNIRGRVDRTPPIQASDTVHMDVSQLQIKADATVCVCFRNDFDWSEVSLSPGDGWGEYVEEYESSLCVSLDIDHGYRWDTRWVEPDGGAPSNTAQWIVSAATSVFDKLTILRSLFSLFIISCNSELELITLFQILPGGDGVWIRLSNWTWVFYTGWVR